MSPKEKTMSHYEWRFPRASGDEPNARRALNAYLWFSPRERG